ncbi:hypothetical protein B0H13DRAFT_1859456 [Mycena leptocephala]|nr:hypothetical protein B0H13DRAFT_1859456 [Mycena leptocephala]
MWLPHSFIAVLFAVLAQGALTNTTIDDTSFTFVGNWSALSTNTPCTSTSKAPCPAQPDPSQTSGGTWHVGTIHPGDPLSAAWGSFTFKGSAVYVFGIDQTGQAEIDFALDNDNINNPNIHKHHYTGTQQFAYNAPFFSATGLTSDQMHTVYWGLKTTGNAVQFALFDYAIVTSGEDGMPTTGAVVNSGPATTQTTTKQSQQLGASVRTGDSDSVRHWIKCDELPNVWLYFIRFSDRLKQFNRGKGQSQAMKATWKWGRPTDTYSSVCTATPSSPPTHHSTSNGTDTDTYEFSRPYFVNYTNGAIAGGVIGAVFAALVIGFVWLRCRKDYYATQDASPPSSTHQVNPFPVSVDRSIFKGEHLYNNSETGLSGPSAASLLPPTDAHAGMTYSDSFPFPQSEPAATDTSHYQERPSADEGMIGDARSTSADSRPSISSSEDND